VVGDCFRAFGFPRHTFLVALLTEEEFRRRALELDGASETPSGELILDSLAALELLSVLHQEFPDKLVALDQRVDIYDSEAFASELRRIGVIA